MASQSSTRNHGFYGKPFAKSGRRSNGGRPRKMYPYVTKDQKGGPMERMIHTNYKDLQAQYNAANRGPGVMEAEEASGRLGKHWGNIKRRMTSGGSVTRHIVKHGGSVGQARKTLIGMTGTHFGADPQSR